MINSVIDILNLSFGSWISISSQKINGKPYYKILNMKLAKCYVGILLHTEEKYDLCEQKCQKMPNLRNDISKYLKSKSSYKQIFQTSTEIW